MESQISVLIIAEPVALDSLISLPFQSRGEKMKITYLVEVYGEWFCKCT